MFQRLSYPSETHNSLIYCLQTLNIDRAYHYVVGEEIIQHSERWQSTFQYTYTVYVYFVITRVRRDIFESAVRHTREHRAQHSIKITYNFQLGMYNVNEC